jgi:hypothetical protein
VELRNEIAQRPISEAEASGDRMQRMPFDDHGADRFVATLLRQLRIGKELLKPWVVHDRTSEMSLHDWREPPPKDTRKSSYRSRAQATVLREIQGISRPNAFAAAKCLGAKM